MRDGVFSLFAVVHTMAFERIEVGWDARVARCAVELVSWRGTFEIVGGTGRYEALCGEGEIAGCFLCSDPAGCASLGAFRDGQYVMVGRYRIPEEAVAEPER